MKMRLVQPLAILVCLASQPLASAAELRATVYDSNGNRLSDAVVVAFPEDGQIPPAKRGATVEDQIDKEFVPYVQLVRVGSYVNFPNKDNIRHHVYSFSPAKRFELPLYSGTPTAPVLFDKVGVVVLGCNIHDWMIGYIYVTDAPHFGKTAEEGRVELTGLRPGAYRVRVWHPRLEATEESTAQRVEIQNNAPNTIQWNLGLKREFRPRRAPLPDDPGYR
jgi:plastocyanin